MKKRHVTVLGRREFLSSVPLLFGGGCLTGLPSSWGAGSQAAPAIPEELTPAELEVVKRSAMAGELEDYFGKGYSCAESLLMVGLRHLQLPEEFVWTAAGFGGGMLHREACGFLTAGIMSCGLAAGQRKIGRPKGKDWCKQKVNAYWSWWTAQAPIKCADIRKEGTSSKVCRRLGLLAAAKVERLIKPFPLPDESRVAASFCSGTRGHRSV